MRWFYRVLLIFLTLIYCVSLLISLVSAQIADTTRPTVTIEADSLLKNKAFDITITFSEAVSGFVQSDVVLSGTATASITAWREDTTDTVYTATITPTTSGTVIITIAAGLVKDAANNSNTAATLTVNVDLDSPQVVGRKPGGGYLVNGSFSFDFRFSETVSGFVQSDVVLSGTATASITAWKEWEWEDYKWGDVVLEVVPVYTATITPTTSGTVIVSIPSDAATDAAGNELSVEDWVWKIDVDFDPPTVTITTETDGAQILPFTVIVTFSETVRGFNPYTNRGFYASSQFEEFNVKPGGYLSLTGLDPSQYMSSWQPYGSPKYGANLAHYSINKAEFRYSYTGSDALEFITFNIDADVVTDAAGNGNTAATELTVRVATVDVNADGDVDIDDVRLVVVALGQTGGSITDTRTDVNGDGTVDKNDVLLVIDSLDSGTNAPQHTDLFTNLSPDTFNALDPILLTETLDAVRLVSDGSLKYLHAIALLEHLLAVTRPEKTQLLANYPNPFNPETWIPYELSESNEVRIRIYDVRGRVVRDLQLGHQPAGYYTSRSRAAYWDGRNDISERVASGIYFYQLQADNTSSLRKMLILK